LQLNKDIMPTILFLKLLDHQN